MKTYLEFKNGKTDKFWKIEVDGASYTIQYGKIGTSGQSKKKDFDSETDAMQDAMKLVVAKKKKGYHEPEYDPDKQTSSPVDVNHDLLEKVDRIMNHATNVKETRKIIKEHEEEFSSEQLIQIYKACYPDVLVNHEGVIDVCRIMIKRKDIEAQIQVVEHYLELTKVHDLGHRYKENTIQDKLIDVIFPKFEETPLTILLDKCSDVHLAAQDGDDMIVLFEPAFKKVTLANNIEKLTARLQSFIENWVLDGGTISNLKGTHHIDLKQLKEEACEKGKPRLQRLVTKYIDSQIVSREEIEKADTRHLEEIIFMLGESIVPGKDFDDIKNILTRTIYDNTEVSQKAFGHFLSFVLVNGYTGNKEALLALSWAKRDWKSFVDWFGNARNYHEQILEFLNLLIYNAYRRKTDELLQKVRELRGQVSGKKRQEDISNDLERLFRCEKEYIRYLPYLSELEGSLVFENQEYSTLDLLRGTLGNRPFYNQEQLKEEAKMTDKLIQNSETNPYIINPLDINEYVGIIYNYRTDIINGIPFYHKLGLNDKLFQALLNSVVDVVLETESEEHMQELENLFPKPNQILSNTLEHRIRYREPNSLCLNIARHYAWQKKPDNAKAYVDRALELGTDKEHLKEDSVLGSLI